MKKLYLKVLFYLCRREIKKNTDNYPVAKEDLIRYYDFLAVVAGTSDKSRLLGITLSTVKYLEASTLP